MIGRYEMDLLRNDMEFIITVVVGVVLLYILSIVHAFFSLVGRFIDWITGE